MMGVVLWSSELFLSLVATGVTSSCWPQVPRNVAIELEKRERKKLQTNSWNRNAAFRRRIFVQCSPSHFRRMSSPSGDRNVLIRLSFSSILSCGAYKIDTNKCLFRTHYAIAPHNLKKAPSGRGYEKRAGLWNLSLHLASLFLLGPPPLFLVLGATP